MVKPHDPTLGQLLRQVDKLVVQRKTLVGLDPDVCMARAGIGSSLQATWAEIRLRKVQLSAEGRVDYMGDPLWIRDKVPVA